MVTPTTAALPGGEDKGDRTPDTWIHNPVLYQLSYILHISASVAKCSWLTSIGHRVKSVGIDFGFGR